MFMSTLEENQLSLEWRKQVIDSLIELRNGQKQLQEALGSIKESYARADWVNSLERKVEDLRLWKSKIIGITITLNVAIGFFGWVISNLIQLHR